ncbi:MAG: hypothetical protein LC624_04625 [Halobacteriales archaeon]|nr:hypothetical protein [Halobacteriales archaeon]
MKRLAVAGLLLLTGCLGGSPAHPVVTGLLDFTDGSFDAGAGDWLLHARGQVMVPETGEARDLRLDLAVLPGCAQQPKDWGSIVLGNLAAGGSTNVREDVHAPGGPMDSPMLHWQLTQGRSFGNGQTLDQGCGAMRSG